MIVTYTATRSLISGHTADTVYELDLGLFIRDRPRAQVKPIKKRTVSLGGHSINILHHIEKDYTFSTIPLDNTQIDSLVEFLDSVVSGESFTIDFYGVIGTPDDPQSAELPNGYSIPTSVQPPLELYSTNFKVTIV